jgi:TetR/AcrR family transcriptional regulator, regulator of autoinduction and epiphytic fitness
VGSEPGDHRDGAKDRQARTRLARRAVVEAARALFLERGYPATTIEAISDRSDVPSATVYRLFSSKLGILKALLDVSIGGDDDAVAVLDRPRTRAAAAGADAATRLAGFVHIAVEVNRRTLPIYRILVSAAGSDPDASALLADLTRQRDEGQGHLARSLARAGDLRDDLSARDAADVVHALMSPDLYQLLVADRGWSPERYEQWLLEMLVDQLLPRRRAQPARPKPAPARKAAGR